MNDTYQVNPMYHNPNRSDSSKENSMKRHKLWCNEPAL